MPDAIIVVLLGLLGVILGSFCGAMIWRLRAKQLDEDKKHGQDYDKKEFKRLKVLLNKSQKEDRSLCLSCGYRLHWYDLIPVFSWLSTKGACRKCHNKIGWFEPGIEIVTAILFVVSFLAWPFTFDGLLSVFQFILWIAIVVSLVILSGYDLKWMLLPDRVMFIFIGLSILFTLSVIQGSLDYSAAIVSLIGVLALLPGLYGFIWLISKGAWVGFGDVKLLVGLSFILIDWYLALVALFMANVVGLIAVLPGMIRGKIARQAHIPFGPLLIIGGLIAFFWGMDLVDYYLMAIL